MALGSHRGFYLCTFYVDFEIIGGVMNKEELDALEAVVVYLMQNERISYEEHLEETGTGEGHIYAYAETLNNYINGLYSTGSEPKWKIG